MPGSIRPFVGREAELDALSASVDEATKGFGSLWFVGGEAGIGKSRFAEEVARQAAHRGAGVLWGRCWEAGGAPAYWPWVQVLRQLLRGRDATDVAALLEGRASHLLQLLPELSNLVPEIPRPPELAPEQARFQLFEAVVGVLCDAAVSCPRMVVLEDLHAADLSSVLLLDMLAAPIRGTSLVMVGTFRDAEAQQTPVGPILGRLAGQARTVVLTRLARSEVSTYLGRGSGACDDGVVDAVHRTTEGHPLFLVELVRWLGQGPDPDRLDPRTVALPHTVSGAIQERLDRLSPQARRLLDTASVVGREFSQEVVCAAAPEPCAAPERALAECVDAGALHPVGTGRHRFAHILIREALYRGLSDAQRRALHLRVADVLERSRGAAGEVGWSELAHHYLAAGPRGREGGIRAATRAAEQAMTQLAFDEAAEAYARALVALDEDAEASPVRRFELLLGLGSAHLRRGYVQDGKAACREAAAVARRLGDPELLAQAALEHGSVFVYATVDPELVALLEEARAALGEQESGLRARVLARLASAMQPAYDPTLPFGLAREGIALARRAGDDATLLATLRDGVSALMDMADAQERVELNREHVQIAERLNVLPAAFRGNLRLVFDCIELGDVAGVRAAIEACARIAAAIDHPHYGWHVAALRAMVAIREGRWDEADAWTVEARRLAERARDPNAPGCFLLQHANRLQIQGRHEELLAVLPRVEAVYATMAGGGVMARGQVSGFLARAGRVEEARRHLSNDVVDGVFAFGDSSLFSSLVEVCAATGDRSLAERLHAKLAHRGDGFVSGGLLEMTWGPPVAALLGRLEAVRGRTEEAARWLRRALDVAKATGAAPQAARVERDLAALGSDPSPPTARVEGGAHPVPPLTLRHEGDYWTVQRGDAVTRIKDVKGLHMLHRLVTEPGRELHVLDLSGTGEGHVRIDGDAGELLDERARAEYRGRVASLREELEQAEAWNDRGRAEEARQELGFLEAELGRAVGLGGRERRSGASAERARVNVQRRIKDAIRRIEAQSPALARHLDRSVRTGTFCSYEPE